METKTEYVSIIPHKSIMPKMGRAGYSFPQAMAELIDNSIDAKIDSKKLKIEINITPEKIIIKDDGVGMTKEELAKAFSLAYSSKKDSLGEFGLGLKTACQSLGKSFEILTTRKEDKNSYSINYDIDEWLTNKEHSWNKYPMNIHSTNNKGVYGTTVTITSLNTRKIDKGAINKLIKDIGTRFAPFISSREINVSVNGKLTEPFIPDLTDDGKTKFAIFIGENKIWGWYGLMKESSQKGFYGFNIFRRGRMIRSYDKIGIPEHATVAKIIGEIHMDHIPVTHNKREFIKDSEEYILAEEALSKRFKEIVRKARKTAKDDKVTSKVKEEVDIWKDKISESLNLPEFKDLLSPDKKENNLGDEKKFKKEEIEKRDPWKLETPPIKLSVDQEVTPRVRKPRKTHKKRHTITIKGHKFDFNVDYAHLEKNGPLKQWSISKTEGIDVVINTDFPAWLSTKDTIFYVVMLIAESLAEIICKESNEESIEKINEIRETILRKASELKNQFEEEVVEKVDEMREATSFLK